jgi:hypothetical protein
MRGTPGGVYGEKEKRAKAEESYKLTPQNGFYRLIY